LQQCSADIGLDGATTTPAADMTASATTTAHDEVFSEEAHPEREISVAGITRRDGVIAARAIERSGRLSTYDSNHQQGPDGSQRDGMPKNAE
jgi:hypothetical protein